MSVKSVRISAQQRCSSTSLWTVQIKYNEKVTETQLADPGTPAIEAGLRWYYEKYLYTDPFSITRATAVEADLEYYAKELYGQVIKPLQEPECTAQKLVLNVESGPDDHSLQNLHWEALEHESLGLRISVRRVLRDQEKDPEASIRENAASATLKLLFLTARIVSDDSDDADNRMILEPVVDLISKLGPDVDFDVVRPGTLAELKASLARRHYDLLHLDVHGRVHKGRICLRLIDEKNPAKYADIAAEDLGILLAGHSISTVVLNACNSASASISRPALAVELLKSGVQSVLGMSYTISTLGAAVFMQEFYKELLQKRNCMEDAVLMGRMAMKFENFRRGRFATTRNLEDWLVPTLFQCQQISSDAEDAGFEMVGSIVQAHARSNLSLGVENAGVLQATLDAEACAMDVKLSGRNLEAAKLESMLLFKSRLVQISAQIGMGKTTFVREFSNWWQKIKFVDLVCWVDFALETASSAHEILNELSAEVSKNEQLLIVLDHYDKIILNDRGDQGDIIGDFLTHVADLCKSSTDKVYVLAITSLPPPKIPGVPTFDLPALSTGFALELALAASPKARIRYQTSAMERSYSRRLVQTLNNNPLALHYVFGSLEDAAVSSVKDFTLSLWTTRMLPPECSRRVGKALARFDHLSEYLSRNLSTDIECATLVLATMFTETMPSQAAKLLTPVLGTLGKRVQRGASQRSEDTISLYKQELAGIERVLRLLETCGLVRSVPDHELLMIHPLMSFVLLSAIPCGNEAKLSLGRLAFVELYEKRVHSQELVLNGEKGLDANHVAPSNRSWPTGNEFLNFWIAGRLRYDMLRDSLFKDAPLTMLHQMLVPMSTFSYSVPDHGLVADLCTAIFDHLNRSRRRYCLAARLKQVLTKLCSRRSPVRLHAQPDTAIQCDCRPLRRSLLLSAWLLSSQTNVTEADDIEDLIDLISNLVALSCTAFPDKVHRSALQDVQAIALQAIGYGHYKRGDLDKAESAMCACRNLVEDSTSNVARRIKPAVSADLELLACRRMGGRLEETKVRALRESAFSEARQQMFHHREEGGNNQYVDRGFLDAVDLLADVEARDDLYETTNLSRTVDAEFNDMLRNLDRMANDNSFDRQAIFKQLEHFQRLNLTVGEIKMRDILAINATGRMDWIEALDHWQWVESKMESDLPNTPRTRVERAWLIGEEIPALHQLQGQQAVLGALVRAGKLLSLNTFTREERATYIKLANLYLDVEITCAMGGTPSPVQHDAQFYIRYLLYLNDPTTLASKFFLQSWESMPARSQVWIAEMKQREDFVCDELINKFILQYYRRRIETTRATIKELAQSIGQNWIKLELFFSWVVRPLFARLLDRGMESLLFHELVEARRELVRILFAPSNSIGELKYFDRKYWKGLRTKWPKN